MAKPLQTQWDFSAPVVAAAQPARKVFSVAELTAKIRALLEGNVGRAWVSGEITNLRVQASGHAYFTLKDLYAQVSCVLFKADARAVDRSLLKDGQTVVLQGEMTVYEPRGQYQMRVVAVELQGQGKLQAAFERLKQKLNAEGLFAAQRKRPIPRCPARLGLVTSLDGAALRDVLHVVERRQPTLEIFLAPCRVQGPSAAPEIARSLRLLNDWSAAHPSCPLDLILLTRGGGSLEDLWAFNEEETARAIVASRLPAVSAVGHEIDFTISDFAADLRAATPSAAAEQITEGACSIRQALIEMRARLGRLAAQQVGWRREELARARRELDRREPTRVLRARQQRLDELREAMARRVLATILRAQENFRNAARRFIALRLPDRLHRESAALEVVRRALRQQAHTRLREARHRLASVESQLRLLGPEQTLLRGYSITTDAATGAILRDAAQVGAAAKIRTRLAKGELHSTVDSQGLPS